MSKKKERTAKVRIIEHNGETYVNLNDITAPKPEPAAPEHEPLPPLSDFNQKLTQGLQFALPSAAEEKAWRKQERDRKKAEKAAQDKK